MISHRWIESGKHISFTLSDPEAGTTLQEVGVEEETDVHISRVELRQSLLCELLTFGFLGFHNDGDKDAEVR